MKNKIIFLQNLAISILSLVAIGGIFKGNTTDLIICYTATGFCVFVTVYAIELKFLERGQKQ